MVKIYVQPEAQEGIGTLEKPYGSINQAISRIRQEYDREDKMEVVLRGGVYYLENTIEFMHFSKEEKTIHFHPYQQEQVIIAGSKVLPTTCWEHYSDKIYVCHIGQQRDFDLLFVDGQLQIMARYPNYREDCILNGYAADAISPERVGKWKTPQTGFIRALHEHEWGSNSYRILGKYENNQLQYEWVGDHNQGNGMHHEYIMVENIFEELDAPGEWFYEKESGLLYYYPPQEVDITKAVVEGAVLEELIRIVDCKSNIIFEGITFSKTHRTLFNSQYEHPLRGDWGLVRKGAIYIEGSKQVSIKECEFSYLGGNAIMMSGYNENHQVSYNRFHHIGASAVLIVGLVEATRDPSTWDQEDGSPGFMKDGVHTGNHKTVITDDIPGPKTEDYPRKITVSFNEMTKLGLFEKQVAGVCVSIANKIRIANNTIHDLPRAGINISDGTFGGHIVENNDIFDTVKETGDHGPFNSWGRDRFWSLGGFVHDSSNGELKRPYALLDAIDTTIIRHNRIQGKRGFGIDLDDGSTNYEIYNNLCLGVGIKCREGFLRKVYNNVLVGAPLDIHCIYANNDDVYEGNLVVNSTGISYAGGGSSKQTTVYKNMMYYNEGRPVLNDVDGVPLEKVEFVAPEKNDYRLTEDSDPIGRYGFHNFPMSDEEFGCSFAVKSPIYKYVSKVAKKEILNVDGLVLSDVSDSERSAAASKDYDGVYIQDIDKESPYAESGLKKGQIIRSVNGNRIRGMKEFQEYFSPGMIGMISFVILEDSKERELNIR